MAKTDIERAFRIFPIHRDDWELLGTFWENQYFVDLFVPFGLRSAPFKFNIAVAWIFLHKCLISYVDLILDYFFIMEPKVKLPLHDQNCKVSLQSLLLTLKNLGITFSKHKTEDPFTVLQFLGILLDSIRMTRLPEDKVQRLRSLEYQEVCNFARNPVSNRHPQLCLQSCPPWTPLPSENKIKLNASFREEILMWQTVLDHAPLHRCRKHSRVFYGGILGTQWFLGK